MADDAPGTTGGSAGRPSSAGLRNRTAIAGIGTSAFHEGGGHDAAALVADACERAIDDAGLPPAAVDGVVTETHLMPDVAAASDLRTLVGIEPGFVGATLPLGAGNVTAPLVAAQAIASGTADHVICYFGTNWATQLERSAAERSGMYRFHTDVSSKASLEVPFGWFPQPTQFAGRARRHMHEYGTTSRQLAEVAIQTRANAARTDDALRRDPIDHEDYRASPMLVSPFRLLDCCLITDGAAAFVVSSAAAAEAGPTPPVYVTGVASGVTDSGSASYMTQGDLTASPARVSGPRAYGMAGVGPADIDVMELYDCFTSTTLVQLEDLGVCEKGAGGAFVADRGITVASGALPVNTHGGNLSHAYLLGMTHVVEAVRQLRGTADNQVADAHRALVAGWTLDAHGTLILEDAEA